MIGNFRMLAPRDMDWEEDGGIFIDQRGPWILSFLILNHVHNVRILIYHNVRIRSWGGKFKSQTLEPSRPWRATLTRSDSLTGL